MERPAGLRQPRREEHRDTGRGSYAFLGAELRGRGVSGRGIVVKQTTAVSVVYVAAVFLNVMDTTIVNVALPSVGRAFSVPSTSVDAVSISYLVSLAVFIPASGWLGDRFGGKRVLLTALAVFTLGSALSGLATSLGELIAFRLLQGAGAACSSRSAWP